MKHQIVRTLQKYFLDPPIKLAVRQGLPLPGYALLESNGRKTGMGQRRDSKTGSAMDSVHAPGRATKPLVLLDSSGLFWHKSGRQGFAETPLYRVVWRTSGWLAIPPLRQIMEE